MSDEDGLAMEEEEVIRMQKEKFKKLSVADYGIEEADDGEATIVVVSGDDDLLRRDDIGGRRRKHELRVLSRTGTRSEDDAGNKLSEILDEGDADLEVSEMEVRR